MFGFYRDLTVIEGEVDRNYIISKLYHKLHLCFVEMKCSEGKVPIGIGFPEYLAEIKHSKCLQSKIKEAEDIDNDCNLENKKTLGRIVRLFSLDEKNLQDIHIEPIFKNMKEYIHVSGIRKVSTQCSEYVIYKRIQSEPNLERLARRAVKRSKVNISFEDVIKKLQTYKQKKIEYIPYVNMKSRSSNNHFKLFIQECVTDKFNYDGFNSYGLSNFSTIPKI
jgi:CRISPR-associated endonuclease Csy4